MTEIAKIALIGSEVTITKAALERFIKVECNSSEAKQRPARIIQKIEKATQKTRDLRAREQQTGLGI